MNLQQQVQTQYGAGTIVKIEGPYGPEHKKWFKYGVKFYVWPDNLVRVFTDEIVYFYKYELLSEVQK